jgi:hypothetical protein
LVDSESLGNLSLNMARRTQPANLANVVVGQPRLAAARPKEPENVRGVRHVLAGGNVLKVFDAVIRLDSVLVVDVQAIRGADERLSHETVRQIMHRVAATASTVPSD